MIKDIITNRTEQNHVLYEKCSPVDFDNKFQLVDDEYVARAVRQMLNGIEMAVFGSGREASRETGVHVANINKVCNGDRETAGGFTWRYA